MGLSYEILRKFGMSNKENHSQELHIGRSTTDAPGGYTSIINICLIACFTY